jgi:hypothetical protein
MTSIISALSYTYSIILLPYEMSMSLIDLHSISFISLSISTQIITLFIHTHSLTFLITHISYHLFITFILIIILHLIVDLSSFILFGAQ